jgi:DNA-binding transcriptional MerR regulator
MNKTRTKARDSKYRIGAVSRLTGITQDILRVWERRYGVVQPKRSEGGDRLYSREDVTRLTLIKRLVDADNAISTVARLTLKQLQQRLEPEDLAALTPETITHDRKLRALIFGRGLDKELLQNSEDFENVDILANFGDMEQLSAEGPGLKADVLLVTLPSVHLEDANMIIRAYQRSKAHSTMVVYGFGTSEALGKLASRAITTLRSPVSALEIERLCLRNFHPQPVATRKGKEEIVLAETVPGRRFDDETLAKLAVIATSIKCECPHHLVALIGSLAAFEQYSAECENRNPEDSALHAYLHAQTAQARATIENVLAHLVEVEGLEA